MRPVNQTEIDVLHLQIGERFAQTFLDERVRMKRIPNLCRDEQLIALHQAIVDARRNCGADVALV